MGIGGRGGKNKMVKGDGGCVAGFSVVFSSLKADTKEEKRENYSGAGGCFICFSAPTFFVSLIILAHT